MKRIIGLVFFCVALALAQSPGLNAQQTPVTVAVKQFQSQPLPVHLLVANLNSFMSTSELQGMLLTDGKIKPTSAEMFLVIYRNGAVVSGEGWKETTLNGSFHHRTQLALAPGDHAFLMVRSVTTKTGTQELQAKEMNEAIQAVVRGDEPLVPRVEISVKGRG